jgi:hypothetical protein
MNITEGEQYKLTGVDGQLAVWPVTRQKSRKPDQD